ncbi:hypothetical protein DPM19_30755 [Actinomadura craniellae]|uniref:Uncharacterized protein n=1 Tax=Actinomadura craniellae TaxID=2231787 RepID=A0A365GX61_9ACTN|nr:hypothetical protein [Actinomadura craniellae]RAY11406.1 hypothetical protein DPM19_30755 [Actinomadura craniellae]
MIGILRKVGISSKVLYSMGFCSIGLSVASWFTSKNVEPAGIDRADRWGIFVGQWAPTFFALGTAMRLEEEWGEEERYGDFEARRARARETMPVG